MIIDDIRIFEYNEDYSDKNKIGDIIEVEPGVFGIIQSRAVERDELELRVVVNTEDRNHDQITDDLLEEIFDYPENKKSAEALIKYFNEKFKK